MRIYIDNRYLLPGGFFLVGDQKRPANDQYYAAHGPKGDHLKEEEKRKANVNIRYDNILEKIELTSLR